MCELGHVIEGMVGEVIEIVPSELPKTYNQQYLLKAFVLHVKFWLSRTFLLFYTGISRKPGSLDQEPTTEDTIIWDKLI